MSTTRRSAAREQLSMTEIPQGFSFEETDNDYILRRNVAGMITELRMLPEEFDALKATIDL
jgi:hypothetical protein